MKCLVVTHSVEADRRYLKEVDLKGLDLVITNRESEIAEHIRDAEIVFAAPPLIAAHLETAEKLKWVQSMYAGVDALLGGGMRTDYILTNVKDIYGHVVADYVFAYVLGITRDVFDFAKDQSQKAWNRRPYNSLEGRTIGIAGTGSIGKVIAKRAKAHGLTTYGLKNTPGKVEYFDKVFTTNEIHSFVRDLDFLVTTLPDTSATNNLFNYEVFKQMKRKPILINTGRGATINDSDLLKALDADFLSKAVLDVFRVEPLDSSSPYWEHDKVIVTPHVSGHIVTDQSIAKIFEDNYRRFCVNEPMRYLVDFGKGY